MNDMSTFAIEHLHIINPAMEDEECQQENWYPDVSTTTESTTSSSTTVSSTTATSSSSTTASSTSSTEETTTSTEKTSTSSESTTQSESTTEEVTTTTEEETTSTTESDTSTSETTSTEDPSTTSSETQPSSSTTDTETTPSSSTTEQPSDDPERDLLYLYIILALGAVSIISGIIIFTIVVCKTTGSYRPKTPTTMSNVRPEPLNNASASLSEFSIVSDKSLQNMPPASQIPRVDAKRNESGLSSNSTAVLQGS